MKKTLLLAAFCAATAGTAQAQITLNATDHMPQPGSFRLVYFADTSTSYQLPASGTNVTWDFSGVIPAGQDSMEYFACVPQANCSGFGNANLLSGSVADSAFEYYKADSNAFRMMGVSEPGSSFQFTDPYDLYRFPFTYNTQYIENYSANVQIQGAPFTITLTGRDSVSGAGYGTLITPAGTYPNALMLRCLTTRTISIPGQGVDSGYSYRFEWFTANSRYPVMQLAYEAEEDGNGQLTLINAEGAYRISGPLSVETPLLPAARLQMVPNPAYDQVRIQIPEDFQSGRTTALVTDLTGKTVFRQVLNGAAELTLQTADWAKGLYLVQLQSEQGTRLMERLSVR